MRLLVQHAYLNAGDYEEVNSAAWAALPAKPLPDGTDVFDNSRGWIVCVNVQGVPFEHWDHYAIEHVDAETIVVTVWNDDPEDHLEDFHADVWTLKTPAPDVRIGGRMNTRQSIVAYAENWDRRLRALHRQKCSASSPWKDFVPPPASITRHGIWMPDQIMAETKAIRRRTRWEEWIEA